MDTEFQGPKLGALLLEAGQMWPATLLFRLRSEAGRRLGLHRRRYRPARTSVEELLRLFPLRERTPRGLLDHFRSRARPAFYFTRTDLPALRAVWQARFPGARDTLLAAAERIERHEFNLLGARHRFGPDGIDWSADFGGAGRWPDRHWTTIDIRSAAAPGDVKRTWELNRTQFFVTLARAWALTGDERHARTLARLMMSWIEGNPPEMTVNWYSNLELAVRAASWMFALEMTLDWSGWDADCFAGAIACLVDHHHHLFKDILYSERCMPGNHLLGDATGLVLLGLYLPELPHADRYLERGLSVLLREGPKEILPDGADRENAVSYHRFVFSMLVLAGVLLRRNGSDLPGELWGRVERMCDFVLHLRTPSGHVPAIGDGDDGRFLVLDDSGAEDFSGMLATGAALFRRGDLRAAAGDLHEETLWLLGPQAARAYDALQAPVVQVTDRPPGPSGIATWRSDWRTGSDFALFKCAPFTGHTHADNLIVLYSAAGRDWIVDRGTYVYNCDWKWRTYFRGTRAHNTVIVDGQGQALAHRDFRWLKPPRQRFLLQHADDRLGFAAGGTTAYERLRPPIRHTRAVLLTKGLYLLVVDALIGAGRHRFEILWHFAPGLDVRVGEAGAVRADDPSGPMLRLATTGSSPPTTRIAVGETDPIQGWHSPRYGVREPAPTAVITADCEGPAFFATLLVARSSGGDAALRIEYEEAPSATAERLSLRAAGAGFDERLRVPNPAALAASCDSPAAVWIERGGERIALTAS